VGTSKHENVEKRNKKMSVVTECAPHCRKIKQIIKTDAPKAPA
jgi:hypothetical protein